ncbi:hypothetical protein LCGC14_1998150 [marine sediment metagenome]|uniref:Uncharacterized protein n=1 Tax=marine sediment metagenome TaxID=412755 RepID=A0A0F9HHH7_9ZZZZ
MNPFRKFKDNPGNPGSELPVEGEDPFAGQHGSLWKFLLKLDKRQAITDEHVRFNTWVVSAVIGIELLILGYLVGA